MPCLSPDQSRCSTIGSFTAASVRRWSALELLERLESLGEASGVRLFRLGERLEPLGDLDEAVLARLLGEARVHLRVLVGLACHRRFQVLFGVADGLAGRRVAHFLEVLEVAMSVAGLSFRRIAEEAGEVGPALHVRLLGEIEIAAVGLALACESSLEVLVRLAALQFCHVRDSSWSCCGSWRGPSPWRMILQNGFARSSRFFSVAVRSAAAAQQGG